MKSRLMTKDFCCLCVANFLMFFSFYALMPLLPFYLEDIFAVNHSVTGIVLASYSVSCILMRPISGYMLDVFRQRPLFLLGYCVFTILFCGYAFSAVLGTFIVFRVAHGAAFGLTSVSGNTIASEIVPQRRMGEGLGYYGLSNTLAMCVGPMSGLALLGRISYDILFILLFALCLVGFLVACMVTVQGRKPVSEIFFQKFISYRRSVGGNIVIICFRSLRYDYCLYRSVRGRDFHTLQYRNLLYGYGLRIGYFKVTFRETD